VRHSIAFAALSLFGCVEMISFHDAAVDAGSEDRAIVSTDIGHDRPLPVECTELRGQCNPYTGSPCRPECLCADTMPPNNRYACVQCGSPGVGGLRTPCTTDIACRRGFVCGLQGTCVKLCCPGDDESCQRHSEGGDVNHYCTGIVSERNLHFCERSL
jgi:hypothetical protein